MAQRSGGQRPRRPAAFGASAADLPFGVVQNIPVSRVRPEEGLGRKRERAGHDELRSSIEKFGVLTPITVRHAPDGSGDYLLVKGQGRTLACRMIGLETVPAVVVEDSFAETEKVRQFLVENVARLRMRPVDRAILIANARRGNEETAELARRFGVGAATVRRLQAQLGGASSGELAALRSGGISLSLHAIVARYVPSEERAGVVEIVARHGIRAADLEQLFAAIGWTAIVELGAMHRAERYELLDWCCEQLVSLPKGSSRQRMVALAERLPSALERPLRRAVSS